MTDNEIIKALEWCTDVMDCSKCLCKPYSGSSCANKLKTGALDLIKRQQAEIERLQAEQMMTEGYADALEERAKAEAIKEFAERLKGRAEWDCYYEEKMVFEYSIDNLVKEMTEGV